MKIKFYSACALLLIAVLCCTALFSCAKGPSGAAVDEQLDCAPLAPVHLVENGVAKYRVVYPAAKGSNSLEARLAQKLQSAISTVTGKSFAIGTDADHASDPAAPYEILVGVTNREESMAAYDVLLYENDYMLHVCRNKVVIVGKNDIALEEAVRVFLSRYIGWESDTEYMLNVNITLNQHLAYIGRWSDPTIDPNYDPTEHTLMDTSTGKTAPRIVTTLYPTEDVVVADIVPTEMGYAVDPTGKTDSTAGIQKAVNDCARNGGGTVYLPAGTYVVSKVITIPAFVTLRGDWQDPDTGNEYGTIISVWTPAKNSNGPALFDLGGSGGVVGLTIYYPHQSLSDVKAYGFAFYSNGLGANYMLSTVKNVTVINGYRGIGCCVVESTAHEQMTIENFKGTFLYCGAEIYNQADVGTWQDVTISPKYWQDALSSDTIAALSKETTASTADGIANYVKNQAVGLKLGDLEWTEFESLKIDGYEIGIEILKGKRIQFAGSLYDVALTNCGKGLVIHDLDPRWGMVIARSTIENGIYNETNGLVKLCDVTVTGTKQGNIKTDNSDLSAYSVNYKASYRKPVKQDLYIPTLSTTGDVSGAIQAQLNAAGANGGGVVYLPAGTYHIYNPISVPAGVELRGATSVATRDQGGSSRGTLLLCYYGDDASVSPNTDTALITLNGDYAGINGIRIIYPENGPLSSNINSTYTVRGKGTGVYAVNCAISASAYGIDFRNCNDHFVKKVITCCYYNAFRLGGTGGIMSGCLQNGTVLSRTDTSKLQNWPAESQIFDVLFNPILRTSCSYIIIDGATNQLIYNTFCYGCANFVENTGNSKNTLLVNIGSDNIGKVQLTVNSGSVVQINAMRWNGSSYVFNGGSMKLYNRLTINNKNEATTIK